MQDAVRVTIHNDRGDWVLRLVRGDSYVPLGALNGKAEAELVQSVLQGALELDYCIDHYDYTDGFVKGMKNASNMVEGRRIKEFIS